MTTIDRAAMLTVPGWTPAAIEATKAELRQVAAMQNARHAQYDGQWGGDRWGLAMVTREVFTGLGTAFTAGELALVRRGLFWDGTVTAYSQRNGCNTGIHYWEVCWIDKPELMSFRP